MVEESALTIDTGSVDDGSDAAMNSGIPHVTATDPSADLPPSNKSDQFQENITANASGVTATQSDQPISQPEVSRENDTIIDERSPSSTGAGMRAPPANKAVEMHSIRNIKVKVEAVLGGISMPVSQLAEIKHGEVICLDRQIGEAIEITANGQLIARGEIVVIEGDAPKFGISLTEII